MDMSQSRAMELEGMGKMKKLKPEKFRKNRLPNSLQSSA
jgi:hypothetical protein